MDLLRLYKIQETPHGLKAYIQNCYGYGDILRNIALLSKIQKIYKERITAVFVIPDPNYILRIDIDRLLSYFEIDIDYEISFESLQKYKNKICALTKFNRYLLNPEFLSDWYLTPKDLNKVSEKDYICVWLPFENLTKDGNISFKFAGFEDKEEAIMDIFNSFDVNFKFISYRTDMDDFVTSIRDARLCIGYDGCGQAIAHAYNKNTATIASKEFPEIVCRVTCPSVNKVIRSLPDLITYLNENAKCQGDLYNDT